MADQQPATITVGRYNLPIQTAMSTEIDLAEPVVQASVPQTPQADPVSEDSALEYDYYTPLDAIDITREHLVMPPATGREMSDSVSGLSSAAVGTTTDDAAWADAIRLSAQTVIANSGYVDPLVDDKRKWVRVVGSPKGALSSSAPQLKVRPNTKLTGQRAVSFVTKSLGMGQMFNVALWHTGIWVRLNPPTEAEILDLYRTLNAEKITLGRSTWGLLFSNTTSYTTRILLDFIASHIHDTSVDLPEGTDIRDIMSVHDIPHLVWGQACAHWSSGFQYSRPCVNDPDKCKHISHGKLFLNMLQRVDDNALTTLQRAHMTNTGSRSMTLDQVSLYKREFLRTHVDQKITLKAGSGDLTMVLKNPTASQHLRAGHLWVNHIEEAYPNSIGLDASARDAYLWQQGRATLMRQYAHYIESVTVDGQTFDQEETINSLLDVLSADDNLRGDFLKAIAKFIDDTVVSMIAINTYECPSCKMRQNKGREETKHPDYIPLDPSSVFFSLVVQRVGMIEAR
jgi:hypothetical protein